MIDPVHLLKKAVIGRCGTTVTIQFTDWPEGKPTADPTTGSSEPTSAKPSVTKTFTIRALKAEVAPTKSIGRLYAEMQTGDCILDMPNHIYRITDPGDTTLKARDVVEEMVLWRANAALDDDEDDALGTEVQIEDLDRVVFTINGDKWVQAEIGEELARTWEAQRGDAKILKTILLRKAT